VSSALPGDIAAVITKSGAFQAMQARYGGRKLDIPARVRLFGPHAGSSYVDDDHWVVSVCDDTGTEIGVFDFAYDAIHGRIRFVAYGSATPDDPRYGHAFPYTQADLAVAQMNRDKRVVPMVGHAPELVYFAVDPQWRVPNSSVHWTGGGASPMTPMWHIVGSDKRDYFTGTDRHTYVLSDLPMAQRP